MPTNKDKKKKERPDQSKLAEPAKPNVQESAAEDDSFDFGGLPKRDLKKNLGCG